MDVKYQVFLSSTFEDLEQARRIVTDEILNLGHIPVGMELFQASDATPWDYIKRLIRSSDFYVVLIGGRYGSTDETGKSFTEKEYEYAIECKVPVLAFLLSNQGIAKLKSYIENEDGKRKLQEFRRASGAKVRKEWTEDLQLAALVGNALAEQIRTSDPPRPGWIRRNSVLFKNLKSDDEDSQATFSSLLRTVDSELGLVGYYRKNQTLDIEVGVEEDKIVISLIFTSKVIPVRAEVDLPTNKVKLDGVKLRKDDYYLDGQRLIGDIVELPRSMNDRFEVQFEMDYSLFHLMGDRNIWTSPVTNYSIRFKKSDLCTFKIYKWKGKRVEVTLSDTGDFLVYSDERGGLTAQGFDWELLRTSN